MCCAYDDIKGNLLNFFLKFCKAIGTIPKEFFRKKKKGNFDFPIKCKILFQIINKYLDSKYFHQSTKN